MPGPDCAPERVRNVGQGSNYLLVGSIVIMILITVLLVEALSLWMRKVLR